MENMTRREMLDNLRANPDITVLVIGGGINGIGTFRDLALQGVDVLLVEKGDFCSGASAASSHMMHGGLRYLENGEFRLVREALHERNRLLQNAPHYVHPLPTTIPIYHWLSGIFNAPMKFLGLLDRPGERGALVIKAGLTMYDLFTADARMTPTHRFFSRRASLEKRPQLNDDIICTATYYDAWMPYPERICMELILDTERDSQQAVALNYVSAADAEGDQVMLRDEVTGEVIEVRPKVVINAAGPWIDFVNRALGRETKFIGGTKGAHLILDHPELLEACAGHEMFFENEDGRITLFFPLQDRVLAGTTDIPIDNPDDARTTDEEIDYILNSIKLVFPDMDVNRSHIVFHFTGVRPLPSMEASTTGQISRDHKIEMVEPGGGLSFPIFSLVGGKWTSFRAFSEQTTDKVLPRLGRTRQRSTAEIPIGGGRDYPKIEVDRKAWIEDLQRETELEYDHLDALFQRYGTYARDVATFMAAANDTPLSNVTGYTRREIIFLAQNEKIVHLDDLLLRRSLLAMLANINADGLAEAADALAEALGWSEAEKQAEIERCAQLLTTKHGMTLEAVTQ